EVEMVVRPLPHLTLNGGFGYTDARLTQDQTNSSILISGSTGLKGDRFPNVPLWNGNVSAEYTIPAGNDRNWLLRGDVTYTGQSASQFRPTYVYYEVQNAYVTAGLRAGLEGKGWGGYVFVTNLFNEIGPMSLTSSLGTVKSMQSLNPRTFGVMARKSF
ncbi:MAG TPA: TonB-dependent receptor plug, partial [Novosphingobium sp.]|nr:TonB-dependent receptor plug [Novosphingobium sp.]